jgi:protoporphyrin/coproporphyrin ferrochelatase
MVSQCNKSCGCTGCDFTHKADVDRPRRAVLLVNLGTPDAPDPAAVRRYLSEFLSDPYVIKLSPRMRWFTPILGRLIAFFRAKTSARAYKSIWWKGGSPLKVITEHQVEALGQELGSDFTVHYAMRYGSPSIKNAVHQIVEGGASELIVLPMYPQYSGPTTGTALEELYEAFARIDRPLSLRVIGQWYDDRGYVESQARLIDRFTSQRGLNPDNAYLLFSTHSMPESYIEQGDPYQGHVKRTVKLVRARLGWPEERCRISYQSKLGPVKWLAPSTVETLASLAQAGEKNVVICPISFTADCLETLEEMGIAAKSDFERSGGTLHLCAAPNDEPGFIKVLAQLVRRGPKQCDGRTDKKRPLLLDRAGIGEDRLDVENLIMVGASLRGRVEGDASVDGLVHVDRETFNAIKRSSAETTAILQEIHSAGLLVESFVWNTCCRYELYGWCPPGASDADKQRVGQTLLDRLVPAGVDRDLFNVLSGADALSHLLHMASGFGSVLPGDADVMDQLAASVRIARGCETADARVNGLLAHVGETVASVRQDTPWGEHCHQYAHVALDQVADRLLTPWNAAKVVLVGGSTTTRSALRVLVNEYKVPQSQISVVYRGGNRRNTVHEIRSIAPQSRRLLVDEYAGDAFDSVIADADIVVMGVDRKEPILDAALTKWTRDYTTRPLTLIDFNSFGSTIGFDRKPGVSLVVYGEIERAVSGFARRAIETQAFHSAKQAAQVRLDEIVHFFLEPGSSETGVNGTHCARGRLEAAHV